MSRKKVTSLKTFAILSLLVIILRRQKFTQLFAVHILTYVPIFVHLSYLGGLLFFTQRVYDLTAGHDHARGLPL